LKKNSLITYKMPKIKTFYWELLLELAKTVVDLWFENELKEIEYIAKTYEGKK
jgi:hypothetical protein